MNHLDIIDFLVISVQQSRNGFWEQTFFFFNSLVDILPPPPASGDPHIYADPGSQNVADSDPKNRFKRGTVGHSR